MPDNRVDSTSVRDEHDPGDEDRTPVTFGPWCSNCGDAFDGPERSCPTPSPGKPYVDCGRGGHMFDVRDLRMPWITRLCIAGMSS